MKSISNLIMTPALVGNLAGLYNSLLTRLLIRPIPNSIAVSTCHSRGRDSSTVEHRFRKAGVEGSNPFLGSIPPGSNDLRGDPFR
jgi:hypothetical protein